MCGFFGIIFADNDKSIGEILIQAGMRLSYRGYDSTGAAVVKKDRSFILKKDAGSVEDVSKKYDFKHMNGYKGITQLRWATYGKPNKINSQPHTDCKETIISAHNGNIINTHNLFETLKKEKHHIKSENDGEVIPHLIEKYLSKNNYHNAITRAISDITGDYAFVMTPTAEEKMYAFKKGSSMFAGIGRGFVCVSSDYTAVRDLTSKIIKINDGELFEFTDGGYQIFDSKNGDEIERKPFIDREKPYEASKGRFNSFMEKEINEVPARIMEMYNKYKCTSLLRNFAKIVKSDGFVITGSGTSYNASLLGAYFLNRIAGIDAQIYYPSDILDRFQHLRSVKKHLLAVSQSGETKDIKNAIDIYRRFGTGKVFAVLNNLNSSIGHLSDYNLPTFSGTEIAVPATKTFINQTVLFYIMSMYFANKSDEYIEEKIKNLVKTISSVSSSKSKDLDLVVAKLFSMKHFHILGYAMTYPVAMEGSLKMKEVNYINVEPMHSAEFKHGPLALVTKNYPIIIVTDRENKHYTLSHINEIKTRGGLIITISQEDDDLRKNSDIFIPIKTDDENVFSIAAAFMLQILSMKIAYRKKINPDKPRNISKTITVD
ncbi:MAG: glutamine--fructose-6-phosphate transaminase (isomerizing) [bacterium]